MSAHRACTNARHTGHRRCVQDSINLGFPLPCTLRQQLRTQDHMAKHHKSTTFEYMCCLHAVQVCSAASTACMRDFHSAFVRSLFRQAAAVALASTQVHCFAPRHLHAACTACTRKPMTRAACRAGRSPAGERRERQTRCRQTPRKHPQTSARRETSLNWRCQLRCTSAAKSPVGCQTQNKDKRQGP